MKLLLLFSVIFLYSQKGGENNETNKWAVLVTRLARPEKSPSKRRVHDEPHRQEDAQSRKRPARSRLSSRRTAALHRSAPQLRQVPAAGKRRAMTSAAAKVAVIGGGSKHLDRLTPRLSCPQPAALPNDPVRTDACDLTFPLPRSQFRAPCARRSSPGEAWP